MKTILPVLTLFLIVNYSCKKQQRETANCFPNSISYSQINNKPASVIQTSSGNFYIIEQGTFDTRLNPCNLPKEFQINNLGVIISGDAKIQPPQTGPTPTPCCTEDFVITAIR